MSTTFELQVDAAGDIDDDDDDNDDATTIQQQIARSLWGVSSLTLVADVSTMLYQPPRGPVFANHGAVYYGILAAILAVVALEMATAYYLQLSRRGQASAEAHGRRITLLAFAKGLLLFAGLLLLFVLAVSGFALAVKAP